MTFEPETATCEYGFISDRALFAVGYIWGTFGFID
jgi:hypothetical protein